MVPTIWLQHILKLKGKSQAEWRKPVIAVFGILRREDLEFQATLSYTGRRAQNQLRETDLRLPKVPLPDTPKRSEASGHYASDRARMPWESACPHSYPSP